MGKGKLRGAKRRTKTAIALVPRFASRVPPGGIWTSSRERDPGARRWQPSLAIERGALLGSMGTMP